MDSKISEVQSYLRKMNDDKIKNLKYKIIIVKDSYFFFVSKGYENRYYEEGHKNIKGWYSGVLSFSRKDSEFLYIFISEMLYNYVKRRELFFKILYQILMYLNLDFFKLKYKKFRKHLQNYLLKNLPKEMSFDPSSLNNLLHGKEDAVLFKKAQIIIPHMSLYNLIERLPFSNNTIFYLNDIQSYLQPFEYMIENHEERHREHHHT